jgi:type IV pilus assembly protein PilC
MSISILYDAGIPINNAFDMIAKSQSNDIIKDDFTRIKDLMNKGYNLSKSIQKSPFISDLAKSLINIGEETGKLSDQLKNLKENSKTDFEEYTETIKKAMTPISTLVIGGVVGTLVVAVYLPIMSMVDLMKG